MRFASNTSSPRRVTGQLPGAFATTVSTALRTTNPGTTSNTTVADRNYTHSEGATRVTDYQVAAYLTGRSVPGNVFSFTSSNPAVGTVNSAGYVSHVSNGSTTVTASYGGRNLTNSLSLSTNVGVITDTFTGFVAGSVGRACWDGITPLVSGFTAGLASQSLFPSMSPNTDLNTPGDEAAENFSRNSGLWAGSIDLSCVPARLQYDGCQHGGVLVTPRHIIFAHHWNPFYQQNIYFVTPDGTMIRRRLMQKRQAGYGYPDITPYELDADVPSTIKPAKLLPPNFTSKITQDGKGIPVLAVRSKFLPPTGGSEMDGRFALIATLRKTGNVTDHPYYGSATPDTWQLDFPSTSSALYPFSGSGRQGDSGSPVFAVVNGEVALLGIHTFSDSGSWAGKFQSDLNARLATLNAYGPTYTLTEFDLSAFPNY